MGKSKVVAIVFIGIAGLALILYVLFMAMQSNYWGERYSFTEDEPYDLNLFKILVDSAANGESEVLFSPISELEDTTTSKTLIFMGTQLYADSLEARDILNFIRRGNTAFICTRQISYEIHQALDSTDRIGDTEYYYDFSTEAWLENQSPQKKYNFEFRGAYGEEIRYWTHFEDSLQPGENVKLLGSFNGDSAKNLENFRQVDIGKGYLYVHTDPLLFTNLYLLENDGFEYADQVINHLPNQPIIWDEYHKVFRSDNDVANSKTPLRFVMQHPPLKYAWYSILAAALLFVVFRSKRQQRIIPLIPRVENTSIAFAQSLGALYYQASSGRYLAIELMKLFNNFNRRKFGIKRTKDNDGLATEIAKKTKVPLDLIESILKLERQIVYNPSSKIRDNVELYQMLTEYYKLVKK
ncbi:hypothetical protein Oweho_0463 [Owenweeksia hongkongensis DSM 17368]|uniref:DUF4350 domain-containing protein n=1 Tax=Owenweeksia hongkongensis (strain DSM 17368 / CIP 108786 / JCM 12287 / NRRL B-23963 / UST20020801) TaxID=926562 RepID=G8QZ98_OWEHD|nr:DUF4350 domain-containing protein [Owenweeksia hongkongensis]AEV31481.1 hypothetical protein Oweho_0463 [Owenweeksia hongkongensis DSM 17368]